MTTAAAAIRVLLVDDSAVIRGALGRIIDAEADMTVATTAPNGRMALDALKHTAVDIVLLDVDRNALIAAGGQVGACKANAFCACCEITRGQRRPTQKPGARCR